MASHMTKDEKVIQWLKIALFSAAMVYIIWRTETVIVLLKRMAP